MKMTLSWRLWAMAGIMILLTTALGPRPVSAKTEIHFWHAMSGNLNDAVEALATRFNDTQQDYEVKPLRKGTYPETMAAALAAFQHAPPPRTSLRRRHANHAPVGGDYPRLSVDAGAADRHRLE